MVRKQPVDEGPPDDAGRERRTGRPSAEQVEEIDRKILETATTLYLSEGPAVTMKAIVTASGLSSKTIYARYPNKEALFLAVLRSLLRRAKPAMDLMSMQGQGILDTLRSFILLSLKRAFRDESVALHRMMSADPGLGRRAGQDLYETVDRLLMAPLTSYLQYMLEQDRIRRVDVARTARALTNLIIAEPAARYSGGLPPPSEQEMTERADFLADLFYHALRN